MKKLLLTVICISLLLSILCGCSNTSEILQSHDQETATVQSQGVVETEPVAATSVETVSYLESLAEEYELNENDISFVDNLYMQREKYEIVNNSKTQQFTRNDVEVNWLVLSYNSIDFCLISYYQVGTNNDQVAIYFDVDSNGNLTENEIIIVENQVKFTTEHLTASGSTNYKPEYTEDEKYKALCDMYSEYKKDRQKIYADIEKNDTSITDSLSDSQKDLIENMLNSQNEWQFFNDDHYFYNMCREIKIWDFGDGTAEILCGYGTDVSIVHEKGFSITYGTAEELDSSAEKRLENDLQSTYACEWSLDWAEDYKKAKLAEYILKSSLIFKE